MSRSRPIWAEIAGCVLLAALLAGLGFWWHHTTRAAYRLRQGQAALLKDDLEEALRQADRLEARGYPDEAHLLRGQAALRRSALVNEQPSLRTRYLTEAIEEYNQIRHENEEVLAEASLIYGLGFLSVGVEARAEKLLLYVAQVRPDNLDARRGLAVIYYDRGAMTYAVSQLTTWSELDPSDGQPYRFMGLIYKDYESDAFAIARYQSALERRLRPDIREEVLIELAEVMAKRTQYAEALAYLDGNTFITDKALAALPELRAVCLYGLQRHVEAIEVLDPLLQEETPTPRALRVRAQIHIDAKEYEKAVRLLQRALQIDPNDAPCRYQLATAYGLMGRSAEAAQQRVILEKVQKLFTTFGKLNQEADDHPADVQIRRRLAEVARQLGKFELARVWRQAAEVCQEAIQLQ